MEIRGRQLEGQFSREIRIERKAINEKNRSVELTFSTEAPCERWFGKEVLGHGLREDGKPEANLSRLQNMHPLLLQHNVDQHIGVIERGWIDEQTKEGKAVARFAQPTNPLAEIVYQDVLDGVKGLVSVGYIVHQYQRQVDMDEEGNEMPETEVYRAVDWEVLEVSIVAIPADVGCKVTKKEKEQDAVVMQRSELADKKVSILKKGYSMADKSQEQLDAEKREREMEAQRVAAERAERDARALEDKKQEAKERAEKRVRDIYEICSTFNAYELRQKALEEGWSVDQLRSELLDRMNPGQIIRTREDSERSDINKSVGQMFVESPQYRELSGRVGQKRTVSVEIKNGDFSKRVFTQYGDADGELTSLYTAQQALPGVPGLLDQQQLRIAQLFPTGQTTASVIRYIKEDAFANYATGVKEAAVKPEATLNVSETEAQVRKVAVYVKVTDEMFADQAMMRAYVDQRLAYMVGAKEDDMLIDGTGTAPEITGLFNVSGINTLAATTYVTVADAFGQAINKVRSLGFVEPDGIIVHPDDWTNLLLSKDQNGQYYAGGPFNGQYGVGGYSNVGRMWGLPVVVSSFCTKGTAMVGAFRVGAQLWRRSGVMLEATNSDQNDFIYNYITIRAESRLALAVYKPLAFCSITAIA